MQTQANPSIAKP